MIARFVGRVVQQNFDGTNSLLIESLLCFWYGWLIREISTLFLENTQVNPYGLFTGRITTVILDTEIWTVNDTDLIDLGSYDCSKSFFLDIALTQWTLAISTNVYTSGWLLSSPSSCTSDPKVRTFPFTSPQGFSSVSGRWPNSFIWISFQFAHKR